MQSFSILTSTCCSRHPKRQAMGICVQCSTPICSECCTRVDGINYCQVCLSRLHEAGRNLRSHRQFSLSNIVLIFTGGLLIWGAIYLLGMVWIRL